MGESFEETMKDCSYCERLVVGKTVTDVLHCTYSNDDCLERYCPAIGNTTRRLSRHPHYENGEPADSQCPTCGSVVMASEITLPSDFQGYTFGFLCGVIGTLLAGTVVLFVTGVIQSPL